MPAARYSVNVHVHRPPAVTLNETPEKFHISTGVFTNMSEDLNQIYCGRSLDMNINVFDFIKNRVI